MPNIYDVAIIGAGPAGANAALSAAKLGCRVVVLDEQNLPGGQVWRAKSSAILSAPETLESTAGNSLRNTVSNSSVTHLGDTLVWQIEGEQDNWVLYVFKAGEIKKIISRALILATGAREFVQPIPGWTTPGVIGLAGATALLKQDLILPGKRTVVSGTGPMIFFVASEVRRLGGEVAAIVTPNSQMDWVRALPAMCARPDLMQRGMVWIADLMLSGVPIFWRHAVSSVVGEANVSSVKVSKVDANWSPQEESRTINADSVCLGNGLIPAIDAAQLTSVGLEHDLGLGGWTPLANEDGKTEIKSLFICGDGAGIRGAAAAEIHGKLAGLSAAEFIGKDKDSSEAKLRVNYRRASRFGLAMTALSVPRSGLDQLTTPNTIICRCESIKRGEIETEIQSGAISTNAVKSGLRVGMGPCGGKYCQTTAARLIAKADGKTEADILPPTPRPPLRPVPASALAGEFEYSDLPIPKPAPL